MDVPKDWVIIQLLLVVACRAQDIAAVTGQVTIGDLGSPAESFSFNQNQNAGNVPVVLSLQPQDGSDGNLPSFDTFVTIQCELFPVNAGYSRATFITNSVSPQGTESYQTQVAFVLVEAGREAAVRCWADSIPSDLAQQPQFTRENSLSPTVPFTVRPPGTVHICSDIELVSPNYDPQNQPQFTVELSETVEGSNVTVNCAILSFPNPPDPELDLDIQDIVIPVGEKRSQVSYVVRTPDSGSPVSVQCNADSQTSTSWKQFEPATSEGESAMFMLDSGELRLYPQVTPLPTVEMKTFLVLDRPAESGLTFVCRVTLANSTEDAQDIADNPVCVTEIPPRPSVAPTPPTNGSTNTNPTITVDLDTSTADTATTTTTTTTTTTPGPGNSTSPSGEWSLVPGDFEITEDRMYQTLTLSRSQRPTEPITELLVVTCCAPDLNTDLLYVNKSTAMAAVAYLSPSRPINASAATAPGDVELETELQNPAYVEVSPCPCDVTQDACDTDCCCDQLCTNEDNGTFTCIPGIAGGYRQDETPRHLCEASYFNPPDWFPLTCIQFERSSFLGYFHFPEPIIRNNPEYVDKANTFRPEFTYEESELRSPEEPAPSNSYKQGVSVKTGLPGESIDDVQAGNNLRLTLPKRTFSGSCVRTAPVRYLQDWEDDCVLKVTEDLCGVRESQLNARMYAQSTMQTQPPCPLGPVVLSEQGATRVASTEVNYLCAEDANSYLRSTTIATDVYPGNEPRLFSFTLPQEEDDCQFDPLSGAFTCNVTESEPDEPVPPSRCSWDDGYTRPPIPEFNVADRLCHHSVVDVLYNFTWSGTEILLLNATIVLANLPVELERTDNVTVEYTEVVGNETEIRVNMTEVTTVFPAVLTQGFQVAFDHFHPNMTVDIVDNSTSQPERPLKYSRSGNPGYEVDLPVISGIPVYNDTELLYVDVRDINRLAVWTPDSTGLCANGGRQVVQFGQSMSGNCMLRLGRNELFDCDYLRKAVMVAQDRMMPSSHISLVGDPSYDVLDSDWTNILRQDLSSIFLPNDTIGVTTVAVEPFSEVTTVMLAGQGSEAPPSGSTQDIGDEYADSEYLTNLQGRCENIPTGIHVDVMYAVAGLADWTPIYRIVGAKIRYTLSSWELSCGGVRGIACRIGSDEVQTFAISSSVGFIEVPSKAPAPKTRYEKETEDPLPVCHQDACWEELFYPFIRHFRGDDHIYTTGFGLVSLIFILGFFFITRPWW